MNTPARAPAPNAFEIDYADTMVSVMAEQIRPDAHQLAREMIANGLAVHRSSLTKIADNLLRSLESPRISAPALDRFADGWTPEQVRELVRAHRELVGSVAVARTTLIKVCNGVVP